MTEHTRPVRLARRTSCRMHPTTCRAAARAAVRPPGPPATSAATSTSTT